MKAFEPSSNSKQVLFGKINSYINKCWLCVDTSFVPPLIYAAMGSSRDIAIGPVAVVSLLLGDLLKKEIDPKKHPDEYLHLAFTATFFAGITEAALGVFR